MANEPKWTPGPWKVFNGTDVFPDDDDMSGSRQVADCCVAESMETFEEIANARLIAAAPDFAKAAEDMCAALSRFGDWDDGCFYYNGTSAPELQAPFQALADAVAKARGK